MAHTPYGYKIEKGRAVIVPAEARQVRILFNGYLDGLSLKVVADKSGIRKNHSGIGIMLENKHYMGDGFYPAVIDEQTWNNVQAERLRRSTALGREQLAKPIPPPVEYEYTLGGMDEAKKYDALIKTQADSPAILDLILKRAESVYMAIESREVITDGE